MNELDRAWAEASSSRSMEEVPLGTYQVEVESVTAGKSKKGDHMLKWKLRVVGGPFKRRVIFKNQVVTPKSAGIVKEEVAVCGLQPRNYTDLLGQLPALQGITLDVRVEQNGQYRDVRFLRKTELGEFGGSEAPEEEAPF